MNLVKGSKVYLYGAGHILEVSKKFLEENFLIEGIIDKKYNNTSDLPPTDSIIIITTIWVTEIEKELREKGFSYIYNIFSIYDNEIFRFHPPISYDDLCQIDKLKTMLNDKNQ